MGIKIPDLNTYINKKIHCSCGRTHFSSVKLIDIDDRALSRLSSHVLGLGHERVFIVADRNTWKAAGENAALELAGAGITYDRIVLDYEEIVPDETAIGEIITAIPMGYDLILAVGSGTINDLCKFVSHRLGLDYIILATAPSMDGFVSVGSALMLHHTKTTLDCHSPIAVIGDTKILSAAPMKLIAAGIGDILGKYTCLLDWKLSHLITGEYYCKEVADMVETALKTVIRQSSRLASRNPEAVKAVTEALVLTGIAMSFTGNSRPASGCEHHMSHYWEMKTLMEGKTPALHGAQVGVAMIMAIDLYHRLAKEEPDFISAMNHPFNIEKWTEQIRHCYGAASDNILSLEKKACKNDISGRNRRLSVIQVKWDKIRLLIEESLPDTDSVISLMNSLGAPVSPEEIGLPSHWVKEAVIYAKEVRDRYTLLQILWDLGLSEEYSEICGCH